MAERSQHRASEGLEGRSECPATGMGSPEPDTRARIKCGPYYSSGTPSFAACRRITCSNAGKGYFFPRRTAQR